MLKTLLERPSALKRHREAPLLKEREEFLRRLEQRKGSLICPRCVLFCLCRERVASLPRPAETAECTAGAIRRPTGRLRSIHGIGTGTVAAIYPVKLLEGIEVSDVVRRATSIPGQSEPQSCG